MWNGSVQQMVTAEGKQKGMRTVLEERGVNTQGLNADKLRELLREYEVRQKLIVLIIHIHLCTLGFCRADVYLRARGRGTRACLLILA